MQTTSTPEKSRSTSAVAMHKNKYQPFFGPVKVQPKLTIGAVDDPYEREADAVADHVMRMPAHQKSAAPVVLPEAELPFFSPEPISTLNVQPEKTSGQKEKRKPTEEKPEEEELIQFKEKSFDGGLINFGNSVQRECVKCEKKEKLQMKSEGNVSSGKEAPSTVHDVFKTVGQPLDTGTRNFMESRFGYDFGKVQVHDDSLAHHSTNDINALAYTHGNHVVFGAGQYQPESNQGKLLLAHELTHVIQQKHNTPLIQRFEARMHERAEMSALTDTTGGAAFTTEESSATYFGNWMRDMNQVFVPLMARLGVPNDVLFSAVSYLAAKKFGRVLTPEQFGYYIPSEHIDNPGGLVAQYDLLPGQPAISSPIVPGARARQQAFVTQQESVDPLSGSVIGANIFSVDQTGTMAYIRRSNLNVERRLDLATQAGRNPEGLMHFGTALHAMEDLFAHSNWIEIAVGQLLAANRNLLPTLSGSDREVFTYSPNVDIGPNHPQGIRNRPVLTTGTFTGTDTQVSISSELAGLLSHPLPNPTSDAEGEAEQLFIRTLLRTFQNRLSSDQNFRRGIRSMLIAYVPAFAVDAILNAPLEEIYFVTTVIPPIVPESIRMAIQSFIRQQLSVLILQPLGHQLQTQALDARISSTSLIQNLRDNQRAQTQTQYSQAELAQMQVTERFTNRTVQQQQADARAEATSRVSTLQNTPEAVLAGPSHSQISKDHPNSPFFGLAFTLANEAVRRMRIRMIAAWNERHGSPASAFDFGWNNFPSVPAAPQDQRLAAENARDLYHQSRPRRSLEFSQSQSRGEAIVRQGGEGAPYNLAAMRRDSADQIRAAARAFRIIAQSPDQASDILRQLSGLLGRIQSEEITQIQQELTAAAALARAAGRTTTVAELLAFADQLDATAGLVENARLYSQRATVNANLVQQRNEAIRQLSGISVNSALSSSLIVVLQDQIANTEGSYLQEQRLVALGGHIPGLRNPALAQTILNLPNEAVDFAGNSRRPALVALIQESRLLMNHPYENNWWETIVRQYIQAHSARILADIEARNQGVALFRRPGERPSAH